MKECKSVTEWVHEMTAASQMAFGTTPTSITIPKRMWDIAVKEINPYVRDWQAPKRADVLEIWTHGGRVELRKEVCKECGHDI